MDAYAAGMLMGAFLLLTAQVIAVVFAVVWRDCKEE